MESAAAALRPLLGFVVGLGLAAVAAAATEDPTRLGATAPSPASVVDGGRAPWVHGGPTGRAGLHDGWRVAFDPTGRGAFRGWHRGTFAGRRVTVPYVPNAKRVSGVAGHRSHEGTVAWYRRELRVARSGRHVLRFASVNHRATVWLDGHHVGTHVGTYLPFEMTLPLRAGRRHRLVVRADWRNPTRMKLAGWHRTWFNFGGINREVTLRRLGRSALSEPAVRTRLRRGEALVDLAVRVRNGAPVTRAIPVTGTLAHGDQRIEARFAGPAIRPGRSRVLRTTVRVPRPALWAPGSPALYDLTLVAGAQEAAYRMRTGLREIARRDGALLLNGRRISLRGASLHEDARGRGDALAPADQDRLVRTLQGLGANATRSQHPLDEGLLERLDAAGLLVWLGVGPVDAPGAWTAKTPLQRRTARRRVLTSLHEAQPHPSVLAWNLVNELAGNGHDATQVAYLRRMTRELHRRDPGRLVALDVWGSHPPRKPGPVYRGVDAIGVTDYSGWYEEPFAPRTRLRALMRKQLARLRRSFRGKILIVSEFGAEANTQNAPARHGGVRYQRELLALHLGVYERAPGLDGALIWALRDFAVAPSFAGGSISRVVPGIRLVAGINQKGLYTYGGRPKPAAAAVRRAFAAAARQR